MGFGKGVIVGLGIALVVACVLGWFFAWLVYVNYNEYKSDVLKLYYVTHSGEYDAVVKGLVALSQAANTTLAYIYSLPLPGKEAIADFIEKVNEYKQTLLKVKMLSEQITPYKIANTIGTIQSISTITGIIGLAMIAVGSILELRERRKRKQT